MTDKKHCRGCGETKEMTEFGFRPSRNVYRSRCNACRRATERERQRIKNGYYASRVVEQEPKPARLWVRTVTA